MRLGTRYLRVALALTLAVSLVSCGGAGTGETAATKAPAAAPATAAPVAAAVPKTLVIVGDIVRGPEGLSDAEKAYLSCVQSSRYPQGSQIVWRYEVLDPMTAKPMDDKQLKTVTLTLPDGKTQNLTYGPHPKGPPPGPSFWTTSFKLPKDYPTGAFKYKVVATDNAGRTGTDLQFTVAAAVLQVVPLGKP